MKDRTSKFYDVCPRQLDCLPCEACPLALDRINAIKAESAAERKQNHDAEPNVGCPWFIASSDHNYCFWSYNESLGNDPASDREISDLLLMSKATLTQEYTDAISKLTLIKDSQLIQDLRDTVMDHANNSGDVDYTTYMPNEFRSAIAKVETDGADQEPKQKVKLRKHPTGLPLHRDKRKVDLYGLYSTAARDKAALDKAAAKEAAKNAKKDKK